MGNILVTLRGIIYILIDACLRVNKVLASGLISVFMGSLQGSTARSAWQFGGVMVNKL
ncbi:hypothetical protein QUB68_11540 [Microcoleus sp. A006_D1]|uniref:hypothetical protein n=1 Tax=Microcoleus sp. A006_D1 TaxID=3055267 RepID=UPI002FCFAEAF